MNQYTNRNLHALCLLAISTLCTGLMLAADSQLTNRTSHVSIADPVVPVSFTNAVAATPASSPTDAKTQPVQVAASEPATTVEPVPGQLVKSQSVKKPQAPEDKPKRPLPPGNLRIVVH